MLSFYWQQAKHFEKQIFTCLSLVMPKVRAVPFTILYITPTNLIIKNLRHFSYSISKLRQEGVLVLPCCSLQQSLEFLSLLLPKPHIDDNSQTKSLIHSPWRFTGKAQNRVPEMHPHKKKEEWRCILILEGKG